MSIDSWSKKLREGISTRRGLSVECYALQWFLTISCKATGFVVYSVDSAIILDEKMKRKKQLKRTWEMETKVNKARNSTSFEVG